MKSRGSPQKAGINDVIQISVVYQFVKNQGTILFYITEIIHLAEITTRFQASDKLNGRGLALSQDCIVCIFQYFIRGKGGVCPTDDYFTPGLFTTLE
jgi:hypothetical protein